MTQAVRTRKTSVFSPRLTDNEMLRHPHRSRAALRAAYDRSVLALELVAAAIISESPPIADESARKEVFGRLAGEGIAIWSL
jgi:hypothetical protein